MGGVKTDKQWIHHIHHCPECRATSPHRESRSTGMKSIITNTRLSVLFVHVSDSPETALAPASRLPRDCPKTALTTTLFPSLSNFLPPSTRFATQRSLSCNTTQHAEMPPPATPPEAPPVEVESPPVTARELTLSVRTIKFEHGETAKGVVNAGMPLVAYSSPPLVEDSSELLDKSDAASQHVNTSSLRSKYLPKDLLLH
jgi:hypothetical protein